MLPKIVLAVWAWMHVSKKSASRMPVLPHTHACRLNLAATCKALHSCCPRWFPVVSVRLPIDAPAVVASLAAWLRRHPGEANALVACACMPLPIACRCSPQDWLNGR